jgi:hypothetical protein
MNTKKVVSISGTVLLTAFAVFVGRASGRFLGQNATNFYVTNGGVCSISLTGGAFAGTSRLTTGGSGTPVFLATGAAPNEYAIYSTSTCTSAHRVHANNL